MNTPQMREKCANALAENSKRASQLSAFVGLDGFVDEILHVVDKRESAEKYFEVMNDMLKKGFEVWVMDWPGQGGHVPHRHGP